jgi:hypothetical protein
MSTPNRQFPTPKEPLPGRLRCLGAVVLFGSWVLGGESLTGSHTSSVVLENQHVRVTRNRALCALPIPGCERRIIVALGDVTLAAGRSSEDKKRGIIGGIVSPPSQLRRGDVVVLGPDRSFTPPDSGEFLEVTIRRTRPPIASPPVAIAPDKNSILHEEEDFFVFEEKLDPGDTRARHSHRERVVIVINKTRLQQWPDGAPELFRDQVPDEVRFNPPVVHVVKTVGELPLRNIVIEFKR